jgi:RNA polymerase sigma factor (sigma-70 family)
MSSSEKTVDPGLEREFLQRMQKVLLPILIRYGIPRDDMEDLLQQCFLRYLVKREEIENPTAWLVVTLRNRCSTYWRDRRRQRLETRESEELEWLAGAQPPEQERVDLRRDLSRSIRVLSPRHRELLRLRYTLGYETEEIARSLAYTPASVRKLACRSLGYLERELGPSTSDET